MWRLLQILAALLLIVPVATATVVVYDERTANIVMAGALKDVQPGPGQALAKIEAELPNESIEYYYFDVETQALQRKTTEEIAQIDDKNKRFTKARFMKKFNSLTTNAEKLQFLAKAVGKLSESIRETEAD